MKKRVTIGRKLYTSAAMLGGMLAGVCVLTWWSSGSIEGRLEETVTRTAKGLALVLQAEANLAHAFSAQKSMVLATGAQDAAEVAKQRDKFGKQLGSATERLAQVSELARDEQGRQIVSGIHGLLSPYRSFHERFVKLLEAGQAAEAYRLFEADGGPLRDRMRADIAAYAARQDEWLSKDLASARGAFGWTRTLTIAAFAGAMFVVVLFVGIVRGICRALLTTADELGQGAAQVTSAAGQVAASSQGLSQGATEQAASLEETSASMEEMASMTRQNAANSEQAAALMVDVARQVETSNAVLAEMVASMTSIRESSGQVTKIIKTIDEIAFQTNILALNAAVEAARAGEAGMGFAVVADEVRTLAQRSAQAARDTAGLIEASAEKAQQGGLKVEQVASAITAITRSVGKVKGLVDEVSVASRQQAQGIEQVTQAITQMEKVTQSTAATAEECAAASEEMSAQAQMALTSVGELDSLVTGRSRLETDASAPQASRQASRRGVDVSLVRGSSPPALQAASLLPLDEAEETGTFARF